MAAHETAVRMISNPTARGRITTAVKVDRGLKTTPLTRASRDRLSGEGGVKFLIRQHIHPVPSGGPDGEAGVLRRLHEGRGPPGRNLFRFRADKVPVPL